MRAFSSKRYPFKIVFYILLTAVGLFLLWTTLSLPDEKRLSLQQPVARKSARPRHKSNRHIYPFYVDASHVCRSPNTSPKLVVFVTSAPSHRSARDAIRSSWAVPSFLQQRGIRVLFLLGHSPLDLDILGEAEDHADIIQGSFLDTYANLTLKTIMMLHWTKTFCPRVQRVMKTDDDVYVNLHNVLHHLDTAMANRKRWIQGCIKKTCGTAHPDSEWQTSGRCRHESLSKGSPSVSGWSRVFILG